MKKLLSFLLLSALILSFAACGSDPENSKKKTSGGTTASASTTDPDDANYEKLSLPELNYDGAKIRLVVGETQKSDIAAEELNNEPVNDAIYNRELFVEDLLSVEIETLIPSQYVSTYIDNCYISGEIPGEIICAQCDDNIWRSTGGYYRDLHTLNNIEPTSVWWSQDFNNEVSVCDLLFFTSGDYALSLFRRTNVVFFNKNLAEDNGITNVYDIVFNGEWTIDKAAELSASVYRDLNGNSERDNEDIYGIIVAAEPVGDSAWSAYEIDILSKDEDGFLVFNPDLERFGIAHEKLCKLFDQPSTYFFGEHTFTSDATNIFAGGRALFATAELGLAETEALRNMQDDYSILPMMKLEESQKNYYTMPHDIYTVFGISSMLDDETAEMSAAVLEAMGWYSYRHVKPAYLDIAMKGKYANDQETRRMIDMIVSGIKIDACWMYAYQLFGYPQNWRWLLSDRTMSYSSTLTSKERSIKIRLKEVNESFAALANK